MTLYEKITELRKRNGLSQEELGFKINVSRQAVSKWEMAQTTPDINKIMALAELFGVSTDFLLKDDYDMASLEKTSENNANPDENTVSEKAENTSGTPSRFISLEEIREYLAQNKAAAKSYVIAVFLFFLSPLAGIILTLFNERAAIAGSIIQIIVLIIAAVIAAMSVWKLSAYKYLKDRNSELAYGVRSIIEKEKAEFAHTRFIGIIVGIICIIGCVIPMMAVSAFTDYNDVAIVIGGLLMLLVFSFGVSSLLYVETVNRGYSRVLKLR